MRIGRASFAPEQIADNVDAVVTALVEKWVPQKWRNVRSIHIKGPETVALPIWLTDELWLDDKDVVADTKVLEQDDSAKKRKAADDEDGEKDTKTKKKAKKAKAVPDADDDQLDKQIAERKAKLKKQKAAAKNAMDD